MSGTNILIKYTIALSILSFVFLNAKGQQRSTLFNNGWKLFVGEVTGASDTGYNDMQWRKVQLPHDGSIEGDFNVNNPAGVHGGFLPTGTGYYRKSFYLADDKKDKSIYIAFDGIYRNSEVWINGHYLGKRPNGYISFRYELTAYLHFDGRKNVLLVKVDNYAQPNSRWYTGSGIYRNVWLTVTNKLSVGEWGVHITSSRFNTKQWKLNIEVTVKNPIGLQGKLQVKNILFDADGKQVTEKRSDIYLSASGQIEKQEMVLTNPALWSIESPYLYTVSTQLIYEGKKTDEYKTRYGLRYFNFDAKNGFLLNGKRTKIQGVCNHHDLGCLGAAVNKSAIQRQLRLLKEMGCNGIRTAHNPPSPELLDLCDEMGFIVMDESFDVWKTAKTPFDYYWNWDEWHKRDLEDHIKRDRNHPCVFIWSIGNEIPEQLTSEGGSIAKELKAIIRNLDKERPVTAGNNHPYKNNTIIQSGALDLIGCNYHHNEWKDFPQYYAGMPFIATETVSALQTREEYMFPSDRMFKWGDAEHPVTKNPVDYTCSAYDQIASTWGATHEETLKEFRKYDFVSGMFVWSGFDYIGEPTPYFWPARSSYFGIIDLAGFPKDVYYLYQSEWSDKTVLHLFPHWNWIRNELVDVWAYYNNADEVELFLNGQSLGTKRKTDNSLHVMWRVPFYPGILKAVSRKANKIVATKQIETAGPAAAIILRSDRPKVLTSDYELAFITATVVDAKGNTVPSSDHLITFALSANAIIAGVDNGNPISHERFKAGKRSAFHGRALLVVQSLKKGETINIEAHSGNLKSATIKIQSD